MKYNAPFSLEGNLQELGDIHQLLGLPSVATDLCLSMLGEKLGTGCYRSTYVFNLNRDFVIKVEPLNTHCNMAEWLFWQEIHKEDSDLKNWFAPVRWISPNGRLLVMQKTNQYPKNKNLTRPTKIPEIMNDVKWDNYGWIGNRFVCHDYASFSKAINLSKKMQDVGKIW